MSPTRRTIIAGLGLLALRPAFAQAQWPTRPVRWSRRRRRPAPPTSSAARSPRCTASSASRSWSRTAGGGGIIGADLVAKSSPDGYTWLTTAVASQAINATLMQQPFDPRKDFRHVTIIGRLPLVMLVNKDLPVQSLTDYVALAKSQPGKLNFGTGGVGTLHHLTGEVLKLAAGIDIVHVPYRGAQAATQDLLGGRIESMFDSLPRRCRICAPAPCARSRSAAPERSPTFPEIATMAEQGFPQMTTTNWFGIAGPTDVPEEIVRRLHAEIGHALATSAVRDRLRRHRRGAGGDTPDQTQAFVLGEIERWARDQGDRHHRALIGGA